VASAPVSAEARGKVRTLLRELETEATCITSAAKRLPRKEIAAVGGFRKGSERALDALVARMPVAPYGRARRTLAWRFLQPTSAIPGAVPTQGGVVVHAVLIGALGRPGLSIEPFGCSFTIHALQRLFGRAGPGVDPVAAMFAAHDALLALGPIEGAQVFKLSTVTMPTPGGAFLASLAPGALPMAVADTWVADGQTYPDQDAELVAWRELLDPVAV
jgi:hypothetical protein